MAPWPRFEYEPLEPRSIRILELQPGRDSDSFQGRFIFASIDSDVEYDALSYMWGDPAPVGKILVAGAAISLASSLSTALRYIRNCNKPEPVRIWIDAICINQQDIREQEEQVVMMRLVYTKAQTVRIWINEPDLVEEDPAVAALCEFRRNLDDSTSMGNDEAQFWEPVLALFDNDYWNRLWIQQEVLNAHRLTLHCKTISVPGQAVTHFQQALVMTRGDFAMLEPDMRAKYLPSTLAINPASLFLRKYYLEGDRFLSLVELLYWCCESKSARPQDRLYAVMQLANDYEEGAINVDYSKSPVQTMLEAASYHVNRNRDLGNRFLHISTWHDENSRRGGILEEECIPTWIPQAWLGLVTRGVLSRGFHRRNPSRTRCLPFSVDTSTRRLSVRGMKVESIGRILAHQFQDIDAILGQFWSSALGKFLISHIDAGGENFPREVTSVLSASLFEDLEHDDIISALKHLSRLSWEVTLLHARDTPPPSTVNRRLLGSIISGLQFDLAFLTSAGYFGSAPICGLKEGDEIWMVLGCSTPIIVRPQPNGTYWHICTAYIPKIIENEHIVHDLTSDVQPGDKVGEWTVQDIQLE